MDIQFGFWPQTFFLVLARVMGVLATTPFFGGLRLLPGIRAAVGFMLALLLAPLVPASWAATAGQMTDGPAVLLGVLAEVLLGAGVGMVCQLFLGVFSLAGDLVAQGAGLTMAQDIDPTSGISQTLLSTLLQSLFVLCVVLCDGHLVLLKLVAGSFYTIPPQSAWLSVGWIQGLIALGSGMYEWGFRLAAPVVATVLILDVGFALIARIAPDFDILFMSIPVRLAAAFVAFGFILKYGMAFIMTVMERMLAACAAMLGFAT